MTFHKKLIEHYKNYDYKILDSYKVDGEKANHYIHLKECIFHVNDKEKSVDVAFNLNTLPDEVAKITLILNDFPNLKKLYIMDSYYFNSKNEILSGFEAVVEFRKTIYEIENYQYELLKNAECFKC